MCRDDAKDESVCVKREGRDEKLVKIEWPSLLNIKVPSCVVGFVDLSCRCPLYRVRCMPVTNHVKLNTVMMLMVRTKPIARLSVSDSAPLHVAHVQPSASGV